MRHELHCHVRLWRPFFLAESEEVCRILLFAIFSEMKIPVFKIFEEIISAFTKKRRFQTYKLMYSFETYGIRIRRLNNSAFHEQRLNIHI